MEVFKAYRFRLEPTSEQAQMLDQWVKRIPRLKKRGKATDSIRFPDGKSMVNGGEHNTIKLPKLGETKFRRSRRIKGDIRNATVSRVAGRWYLIVHTIAEQ